MSWLLGCEITRDRKNKTISTSDVGGRVGLVNSRFICEGMLGGIMCACAVLDWLVMRCMRRGWLRFEVGGREKDELYVGWRDGGGVWVRCGTGIGDLAYAYREEYRTCLSTQVIEMFFFLCW